MVLQNPLHSVAPSSHHAITRVASPLDSVTLHWAPISVSPCIQKLAALFLKWQYRYGLAQRDFGRKNNDCTYTAQQQSTGTKCFALPEVVAMRTKAQTLVFRMTGCSCSQLRICTGMSPELNTCQLHGASAATLHQTYKASFPLDYVACTWFCMT